MKSKPTRRPIKKPIGVPPPKGPLPARRVAAPLGPRAAGPGPRKPPDRRGPARPFDRRGPSKPRFPAPLGELPPSVRIIHEDPDLIVVDKPPGLLTANIPGEARPALFDMLKRNLRPRGPRKRPRREGEDGPRPRWAGQGVYVIHRLDKEASGLLVFARSDKAFTWLKDDFKTKRVHRIYTALVEGEVGPVGTQGTIQSFLRETGTGKVESISTDAFRGPGRAGEQDTFDPGRPRLAVTHYRVLASSGGLTLLQVRIDSGRKHQIRVHLTDRGHPIVGDFRYGSKADPIGRLGLHASELGFTHPGTGQTVRYNSPAPPAFFRAVNQQPPRTADLAPPPPVAAPVSPPPLPPVPAVRPVPSSPPAATSWENVAAWYDQMQGEAAEDASDHFRDVIIPGTIRLVQPAPGERVLDVACGQGLISRALAASGAAVVGIDASPALIGAARSRGGEIDYRVADARQIDPASLPCPFDAAACIMALGNIEPLDPLFRAVSAALRPGGRFVAVVSHPAFRAPTQTAWGWDEAKGVQFRRVDGYLSPGSFPIQMHPGKAAAGRPGGDAVTWTFHRPLQQYARLLGEAGLLIQTIEEWTSMRTSEPGPRAREENRARREIPLFLALRAIKSG